MSVNKLISIWNPIQNAKEDLAIDHDKLDPVFMRWATQAEKEIGSKYQYVTKRAVLKIDHCIACLPNDAQYVQIALLGDFGCDCRDLMENVCGRVGTLGTLGGQFGSFLVIDVGGGNMTSSMNYVPNSIQNNKIVFNQDFNGQFVTIQYLAIQTDCDGFIEVGENHVLAIEWYIIWKYYFRKSSLNSLEYGKMNKAEAEWHRECSHARAQDAEITESDRRKIVGMYHNPFCGIGLSAGMNTTLGNNWSAW